MRTTTTLPVTALALALVVLAGTPAHAKPPTDLEIQQAIKEQILLDPVTTSAAVQLGVKVKEGIARLQGEVLSLRVKRRTRAIARGVRGVRAVIDRVTVRPAHRSPASIKRTVEDALMMDPTTEAYEVVVRVDRGGEVTLTGTVDSWAEKDLAEAVTSDVSGVTAVDNRLRVAYRLRRSDAEIEADVRARMQHDLRLDASNVVVRVEHGKVKLSGSVDSALEREWARQDARVMGVEDVHVDRLYVEPWAKEKLRRTSEPLPGDDEIRGAVEDALRYDARVRPFTVAVHVDGGVVTLDGSVTSVAARRAAARDAKNTVGVIFVNNNLSVRPKASLEDREIEQRVRRRLKQEPLLEAQKIDLFALNGKIYLAGRASTRYLKQLAGTIAARTRGVEAIGNNIVVEPWKVGLSDARLKTAVERELFWSSAVDAEQVDVSADDGVVTLRGTVSSWYEAAEAAREARQAGAGRVRNLLAVTGWER